MLNEGVFNLYNELSVITLLHELGYNFQNISDALSSIEIVKSRLDKILIGNIFFQSMLCKDRNAYAVSRVLEYISQQDGDKEILIYCNNFADAKSWSENTCWLYDCDFELLADERIKKIVVCHDRRYDYKLRLLDAGIDESCIACVENPLDGVDELQFFEGDNIYLLYGTDPLTPAPAVRKKILSILKEKENNLEVR